MREFWPFLGLLLTGTLWRVSGQWEWTIPKSAEQKIIEWKRKWYWPQIIIRVISNDSIEDLEQFAWSLKSFLPKLQRELGVPIHLEIEWKEPESVAVLAEYDMPDISDHVQKMQYGSDEVQEVRQQFSCLNRRFPEFFWVGQAE